MTITLSPIARGPSAERLSWALERTRPLGPAPMRRSFRLFPPRRQRASSEHLYFEVRPVAGGTGRQLLQYAFVDDRGTIVLSVVGEAAASPAAPLGEPPDDLAIQPMDAAWLSTLIGSVCEGASLVAFHKVLQGGLLPAGALAGAASLDCAWRRYLRLMRRSRRFDRSEPVTLDDALEAAGIGAVGAPDAALRALGLRELWAWMDRIE